MLLHETICKCYCVSLNIYVKWNENQILMDPLTKIDPSSGAEDANNWARGNKTARRESILGVREKGSDASSQSNGFCFTCLITFPFVYEDVYSLLANTSTLINV